MDDGASLTFWRGERLVHDCRGSRNAQCKKPVVVSHGHVTEASANSSAGDRDAEALDENVAFCHGDPFLPGSGRYHELRLAYGFVPAKKIATGPQRLATAITVAITTLR